MGCVAGAKPWPLTLAGPVGVGKTCAALAVTDITRGRVEFARFADLAQQMVALKCGDTQRDAWCQFWDRYETAALCVIDDIGLRQRATEHQVETLLEAIERRHRWPVILTTNLTLDQLAESYDDRIASRLSAGSFVWIDGTDRRVTRCD